MDYPIRSIAFQAELIHAPRQHRPDSLQRIHAAAFADPTCQYQNFALVPGGAVLSNPQTGPGMVSMASFLADRVQVREEMSGIGRDDFQARLESLAGHAASWLGVEQFLAQNYVVRSLVNPRTFHDAREFMSRSLLNMEDEDLACLQRVPQILGVRMVFPDTPDQPGIYNVRVESYAAEPRSLFLENVGTFRAMITSNNLESVTDGFGRTYDYLESNLVAFVSQFDGRTES